MEAARKRTYLLVAAIAVAASATVAGVVYATRQTPQQPTAQCKQRPSPLIVPGVASRNLVAVKAAFRQNPKAAAQALEPVAQSSPRDPVVQYNFGVALYCAGFFSDASQAFRAAKSAGRDTYYEMRSDEILHPNFFRPTDGLYPIFQPQHSNRLLIDGVLLQRRGKQRSAEKLYQRAARLHPNDAEMQVAAAVGRFDEDNLSASFSRLGPLVKRFPKSQSVRFHLGLLLAWIGQKTRSQMEFERAVALGSNTTLGREASAFLKGIQTSGTTK
jgi:tetratricopeptide (TPR) repeat protein